MLNHDYMGACRLFMTREVLDPLSEVPRDSTNPK